LIAVCAEGLVSAGRIEEAQTKLDDALEYCMAYGEYVFVPELLRIKGVAAFAQAMLARGSGADMAGRYETEACGYLREAMRMAREQGACMWELRAALDLARHLLERDEADGAVSLIHDLSKRVDLGSNTPEIHRLLALIDAVRNRTSIR
jgi:hypothetical protein